MSAFHLIVHIIALAGCGASQVNYVVSNSLDEEVTYPERTFMHLSLIEEKYTQPELTVDPLEIKVYYESLCPDCRDFYTNELKPVVHKLNQYVQIQTYPYGNAEMFEKDGKVLFKCQHGPEECYGNKLHACALSTMSGNVTQAILYNICMMDSSRTRGSDDTAADKCGQSMSIDSEPVKQCAKGDKGTELLKYYGEASKKVNFHFVPYILIDGKLNDGDKFFGQVCAAFTHPPPECNNPDN